VWLTLRLDPAHCGRRRKRLSVVVLKIEFDFDQLRNKYSPWAGIKKCLLPKEEVGKAGLLPALCAVVSDE
jgi:hypothetical protein